MLTLPATKNDTSFAVAYTDASALLLDALTLNGQERSAAVSAAKRRVSDALGYSDTEEEFDVADALLRAIMRFEKSYL